VGSFQSTIFLDLPATVDSIRRARHAIDALAWPGQQTEAGFNLRLLVTERVTNAIRHAGLSTSDRVVIEIDAGREKVRAEITDPGRGFTRPAELELSPDRHDGRGLFLVDAIATRWDVERDPDGTRVWFELDIQSPNGR
jgi:anti-sigma regulatory factor (Ser/Thr protein kinase)